MSTLPALDLRWQDDARCAGTPVDVFFHEALSLRSGTTFARERALQHQPVRDALNLCALCPVRTDCLNTAMAAESGDGTQRHGIWGGLLPHERAELAKAMPQQRRPRPIKHGTEAGYGAHKRRHETPCDECRAANALAHAARKAHAKELAAAR